MTQAKPMEHPPTSRKKSRVKRLVIWLTVLVFILLLLFIFVVVIPSMPYSTKTKVSEGLVLSETYQAQVTTNILNQEEDLSAHIRPFHATSNTESITVSAESGVITVQGTQQTNQIALILTPGYGSPDFASFQPYTKDDFRPTEAITWHCSYQNTDKITDIPDFCRKAPLKAH